jgi:membrane protease YdiL (CAAX protease family)
MKRLAQFFRSVLPADPWQLVFLTGVIFLFICPRLPWRPSAEIFMSRAVVPVGPISESVTKSLALVIVLLYPALFAGLMGYATCFYPGSRPVRRILGLVLLPALFSLVCIFFVFYQISGSHSSVLESRAVLLPAYRWLWAIFWHFPAGFDFCVFSLLLIGVFVVRLRSGTSSLPLALPGPVASLDEVADSWPKIQILIFTLLAPLFLIAGFFGVLLGLPYFFLHGSVLATYGVVMRIVVSMLDAALLIALALWILGPWGRNAARRSLQLPEPRYAFLGLLLPILISGLPQILHFLIDRTQWAIYFFNQNFPPQIASYLDVGRLRDPWLLLMIFGAFAEEVVFRGLLLQNLVRRYGFHRGIFLTGIVWGAYHFRGDSYSGLSVGGVFLQLGYRILICLVWNYVFAWMTLRWKSIIPAGIAHTVSNILIVAGINDSIPWSAEIRMLEWAVVAFLLFRYWPLARTEPLEETPPTAHLESAI